MAAAADIAGKTRMKSASYGDVIVDQFNSLRKNDELCDFTVSAQGKSIRVRCQILVYGGTIDVVVQAPK